VRVETGVSPVRIYASNGHLSGIECIRNRLGEIDSSGRRKPVPMPGTEFTIHLNTLIVAVGERPDGEALASMGLELTRAGTVRVEAGTLLTSRKGVFAGGDLVTGPNTVVDAIASGKEAAGVIDRYLQGKELKEPPRRLLPATFVEPSAASAEPRQDERRAEPDTIPVESRRKNFAEVELAFSAEQAAREAGRCLRCDLRFTQRQAEQETHSAMESKKA